jgi:ADP-ribose pyrophosphatase YjhB (NUDIX family)
VVREVREETGLESVCGALIGWVERFDEGHHFVILDFEVTVLDDTTPEAGDDAAEAAWVPLEDVVGLRLVDGLAEFLHEHGYLATIT